MTNQKYKKVRLKLGLTQAELANIVGMTQPAIARIETGERNVTLQQHAMIKLLLWIKKKNLFQELLNNGIL